MWVTAAAFGFSILTMAALGYPAQTDRIEATAPRVVSGVVEGLKFVWHNRVLRTSA